MPGEESRVSGKTVRSILSLLGSVLTCAWRRPFFALCCRRLVHRGQSARNVGGRQGGRTCVERATQTLNQDPRQVPQVRSLPGDSGLPDPEMGGRPGGLVRPMLERSSDRDHRTRKTWGTRPWDSLYIGF